jgi:hypothetical protein
LDEGAGHQANFIQAVRRPENERFEFGRSRGTPLDGAVPSGKHFSSGGGHGLGTKIRKALQGNAVLSEAFERFEQHLAANEIDLSETCATLGEVLRYNPAQGCIEGLQSPAAEIANALLTRDYREPFVLSEKV